MYGLTQYLYTSIFGPEKTLFVSEQELQEAKRNLRKTGISLCHEDFFKWVQNNKAYQDSPLIDMAASYGKIDVLEWLYDNNNTEYTQNALDWALYNGNVDIIRWLYEHFEFDINHSLQYTQYNYNTDTI